MNRSAIVTTYSNASVMALNGSVLWLLPHHGIIGIAQAFAGTCAYAAAALQFATARRIERAEKAASR